LDPLPTVLWYDASTLKLVSPRLTSLTLLATSGIAVTVRREGLSENLETLIGTLLREERREMRGKLAPSMVSREEERCGVPYVLLSDRVTEARLQRRLDELSDQEQGEDGDGD
jgi:hypothetical protein